MKRQKIESNRKFVGYQTNGVVEKFGSAIKSTLIRSRIKFATAVLLVLGVFVVQEVRAQAPAMETSPSETEKIYYAIGIKPMVGGTLHSSTSQGYLGIGIKGTLFREKFLLSAEFSAFDEFDLFSTFSEEQYHMNFMLGKYHNVDFLQFYAETGLGLVAGTKRGEELYRDCGGSFIWCNTYYQEESYFTFGVPLQAGLRFIPVDFLAINFNLGVHINPVKPLGYGSITLELGRIK